MHNERGVENDGREKMTRKKRPSHKDIIRLEKQIAVQINNLESSFMKQLADLRELLQRLSFKRALLSDSSDVADVIESK
jgi:hypothetical protein